MRPIIAAALAFVALAGAGAQETGSVPAGRPDAIVDLATPDGARIVRGTWRYHDAAIVPIDLTYDVAPHAGTADFDDAAWETIAPDALDARRGGGLARGWNAPNRVIVARDVRPGETFQVAVFGANAPLSEPPANFVWIRSATVEFHADPSLGVRRVTGGAVRRLRPEVDAIVPRDATIERIATGFQFTEGPVWHPDGYLLFSDPNANTIYRWSPDGQVSVFRPKSGYAYVDDWDVSRKVILRYPVRADGSLGAGAVFADVTRSDPGEQAWDGLEVDTEGHVYAAGPGGIWIFAPDGTQLGTISPPETPANFAWGDADGRTLYITARTSLYRIRLSVPGIRPWPAPSAQTAQTAQTAQRTRTSP